jgi:hypothetical protein
MLPPVLGNGQEIRLQRRILCDAKVISDDRTPQRPWLPETAPMLCLPRRLLITSDPSANT